MSFRVPEQYRALEYSTPSDGNNGLFFISSTTSRNTLKVIASDGMGWEHVSVSKKYECPTWDEMCKVKELFWDDPEDCALQYHPPKRRYANNHPYCLHLWRPNDGETRIPFPHVSLIGIKV
jgi:hypothetical protein